MPSPEQSSIPQEEYRVPRDVTFGTIKVKEDLQSSFVTPEEMKIYQEGFDTLQALMAAVPSDSDRDPDISKKKRDVKIQVLTDPSLVSGLIGLQSYNQHRPGEAELLYQAFKRSNIDFDKNYTFINQVDPESGKQSTILLNYRSTEKTLRKYKEALEIEIDMNQPMTNEAIVEKFLEKYHTQPSKKKRTLAAGLFSGYPLEDCKDYPPSTVITSENSLSEIKNRESLLHIDPLKKLEWHTYSLETYSYQYTPDMPPMIGGSLDVKGFGLDWRPSDDPPGEWTFNKCKELLEVDRNMISSNGKRGLINWINEQRKSVDYDSSLSYLFQNNPIR